MENDIVFDIETASQDVVHLDLLGAILQPIYDKQDEETLELKPDGRLKDPAEKAADLDKKQNALISKYEQKKREVIQKFPLNWYAAQITAIGLLSVDKGIETTTVFHQDKERWSEKDILVFAWNYFTKVLEAHRHPFRLVTYYGKSFDVPFFLFRSMMNDVKPTTKLSYRKYNTDNHLDLFDDVFHEKSLDFWRVVFEIPAKSIYHGENMPELFEKKHFHEIIDHLVDDLKATSKINNLISPYFA